jgi:hypothetical protein
MYLKKYIILIIFFTGGAILLNSCSSIPECYHKGETLKWGIILSRGKTITYEMIPGKNINLTIFENSVSKTINTGGTLPNDMYCSQMFKLKKLFLANIPVNQPGDSLCFIELDSENTGLDLNAVWNPAFHLDVTAEYRKMFDTLMLRVASTEFNKRD